MKRKTLYGLILALVVINIVVIDIIGISGLKANFIQQQFQASRTTITIYASNGGLHGWYGFIMVDGVRKTISWVNWEFCDPNSNPTATTCTPNPYNLFPPVVGPATLNATADNGQWNYTVTAAHTVSVTVVEQWSPDSSPLYMFISQNGHVIAHYENNGTDLSTFQQSNGVNWIIGTLSTNVPQ